MLSKNKLEYIAKETLNAVKAGKYTTKNGRTLSLDKLSGPALRMSSLYRPGDIFNISVEKNLSPEISITDESTLQAALRLKDENPCVLNFASAKNPGGGFLWGSVAQEETIARASNLYNVLIKFPEYYEENKRSEKKSSSFYKDYAIYSPKIVIFRNDDCEWIEEPYTTSIVTSPAPKRNKIEGDIDLGEFVVPDMRTLDQLLDDVFTSRTKQVLNIMAENNHRTIILGAWGCGAFGNDPRMVSGIFKEALINQPFFDKIVFAIPSGIDSENYKIFKSVFKNDNNKF